MNIAANGVPTPSLDSLTRHGVALGASGSGKTVLLKAVIEEAALAGVPCIVIDLQGDMAALADRGDSQLDQCDVEIWSPASNAGRCVAIDPFTAPPVRADAIQTTQHWQAVADSVATILGYAPGSDKYNRTASVLASMCQYAGVRSFDAISNGPLPFNIRAELASTLSKAEIGALCRKASSMTIGASAIMFEHGESLSVDRLLYSDSGKPRLSVISLSGVRGEASQAFWLGVLCQRIYDWMIAQGGSDALRALFVLDECAPFIPPVRKPASKGPLAYLLKQARKYGVGCLLGTQSAGHIDYQALGNIGTWWIGKLPQRQDREKVADKIPEYALEALPNMQSGQFVQVSHDVPSVQQVKVRWLHTAHRVVDPSEFQSLRR